MRRWQPENRVTRRSGTLTPMMESALHALSLGPLDYTPDVGWLSRRGEPGVWNIHTITYMAGLNLCSLNIGRTVAGITERGRTLLPDEGQAA